MRRIHLIAAAAVTLLLPVFNVAVWACPMCKDSIPGAEGSGDPSQTSGGALPGGFNSSVYLMLIGFLGSLGLVSWTLVKGVRSASRPGGFPVVRSGESLEAGGKDHTAGAEKDENESR